MVVVLHQSVALFEAIRRGPGFGQTGLKFPRPLLYQRQAGEHISNLPSEKCINGFSAGKRYAELVQSLPEPDRNDRIQGAIAWALGKDEPRTPMQIKAIDCECKLFAEPSQSHSCKPILPFWITRIDYAYSTVKERFGSRTTSLLATLASSFSIEPSPVKTNRGNRISTSRISEVTQFLAAGKSKNPVGAETLLRFYCACMSLLDEPYEPNLSWYRFSEVIENPNFRNRHQEHARGRHVSLAQHLIESKSFPLAKENSLGKESHLLLLSFLSMIHRHVSEKLFEEVAPWSPLSLAEQEKIILKSINNTLADYIQITGLSDP
jgi:hypothetical protein